MPALAHRIYLVAILFSSILAFGQSGSPQEALEELATTENTEIVLKHLPVSVGHTIEQMSPAERAAIDKQLLIRRKMKEEGVELQRGGDGSTWELTGPSDTEDINSAASPRKKILITIQSAIENGTDALLIIDRRPDLSAPPGQEQPEPRKRESALVRMKFEEGEWRITDVGAVEQVSVEDLLLKDIAEHGDSTQAAKEASAVGTLRTLNTAIISYESTYASVGLPPTIAALACASDETCSDSSAEHAALLDSTFGLSPLVRRGYEFQYTRISSDRYVIVATPVGTDQTAAPRSFYTDESGVIRFTQENRAATAQDRPLQ